MQSGRLRGKEEEDDDEEEESDAVWQVAEDTVTQQDVLPARSVISCELP